MRLSRAEEGAFAIRCLERERERVKGRGLGSCQYQGASQQPDLIRKGQNHSIWARLTTFYLHQSRRYETQRYPFVSRSNTLLPNGAPR